MLEEMRIRGLGVIDDAVLELSPGLTVVSGETGAGKTMVVTGLGLLFGGRADSGAVRPGARTASVEGRLRIDPDGPVAARAQEVGGELDDDVLVLARSVSAEGRSRAHLGGRGVPAATLAEIADSCVAVHGQSDQTRLLQPARQRTALDRYAGSDVGVPLAAYREAFDACKDVRSELAQLTTRARERAQEADVLRFGLEEIEAVQPVPGESGVLAVEEHRLGHADTLRAAADVARAALLGDGGSAADGAGDATGLVAVASQALQQAEGTDPTLDELIARLRELGYLLADVGADLASYAAGIETDPARLATVQDRRAVVTRLVRKYADRELTDDPAAGSGAGTADPGDRDDIAAVLAWAGRAAVRLGVLDGDDGRIDELRARRDELVATMGRLVHEVSLARRAAARRFSAAVTGELAALAMTNAEVEVRVAQLEDEAGLLVDGRRLGYGRHGVDDVEMLLRPTPAHRAVRCSAARPEGSCPG